MTRYEINLVEAKEHGPYFDRPEDYINFETELDTLVQLLNINIAGISCKKYSDTSIVIESKINTTDKLLERINPEFISRLCYINYDINNRIKIIRTK